MSIAPPEHPLSSSRFAGPTTLPADLAKTTTVTGATVNFIVRVETGTMNRGIYQNAILHDPTTDPPPAPLAPPRGWNRRLVALHGSGCPSGWYIQGGAMGAGGVLDAARLGEGYAIYINTLNHPTNSCNAVVAGETAMMGKEHFIETFGVPFYTISAGGSGGAYTSLQIADALPGIFDGVDIRATFPDALSIALSGLDAHLLTHYFEATNPLRLHGRAESRRQRLRGHEGVHRRCEPVAADRSGAEPRGRRPATSRRDGTRPSRKRFATIRSRIPRAHGPRSLTRREMSTA